MATVYEAVDKRLDRARRAQGHAPGAGRGRRVRRAGSSARRESAARLSHPNVVAVYDQGADRRARVFLAMELRRGPDPARPAARARPAPPAEALEVHRAGAQRPRRRPPRRASSTATSSPRTSCSPTTAGSRSPTSGWPGRSTADVAHPHRAADRHRRLPLPRAGRARRRRPALRRLRRRHPAVRDAHRRTSPTTARPPIQVAYQHVHADVPAPSSRVTGLPAELDDLVVAADATRRRPADAGAPRRDRRRAQQLALPVAPVPPRERPRTAPLREGRADARRAPPT